MGRGNDEVKYEIVKDIGAFGDGKWQKHLAIVKWNNGEPKYDLRSWNNDMTNMTKGVTLTKEDLYDLYILIEEELGLADDDEDSVDITEIDEDDSEEFDDFDDDDFE